MIAVVTAATLVGGCDTPETAVPPPPAPSVSAAAPSAYPSAPAPSAYPSGHASAPALPERPEKLRSGAEGAVVTALQQRLIELGYWIGEADGKFGGTTRQAVYALQKTAGIGRDGTVGPKTWEALDRGVRPEPRSTGGDLIEIDLRRQLLLLVRDGRVAQVFNTSTGSNELYEQEGETFRADTPRGRFTVSRQIDGWRDAPLGLLWRPKYFNGGIAVHGAPSVPPHPASHGCARVSVAAMNWLWSHDAIPLKSRVWVY